MNGFGRWARKLSVLTADETPVEGTVPRWEIPGWRERFGVIAGITGRGTLSAEPFDLGLWTASPVGKTMNRWRDFRAAVPQCSKAVLAHQVHGNRVLWHDDLAVGWTLMDGADGHATATPGQLLLVTVADCIPVYLIAPRHRAIALLHSGWRGTAAGILKCGVDLLSAHLGAGPSDIVMHAGVGICGRCYEVGSEVADALGVPGQLQSCHIDLRQVLMAQAAALGVAATASRLCSSCRRDLFFSHRGSGGQDGRMVAYLGMADA